MIIETGIESHPQVEVTGIYLDLVNGKVDFRWGAGAPYTGDCSVSLAVNAESSYSIEDIKQVILSGTGLGGS